MRATVFHAPFDVRIEQVPDAALHEPTDAVVGSPMPASVGRIYGPTEGWNPFHQGGGWAMNGWEWLKTWDLRFRPSSGAIG